MSHSLLSSSGCPKIGSVSMFMPSPFRATSCPKLTAGTHLAISAGAVDGIVLWHVESDTCALIVNMSRVKLREMD